MKLAIIIPAYNEESTIAEVINQVSNVNLSDLGIEKEIMVIDDGSTDKTSQIIKSRLPQVLLIRNPFRQGKGTALRKALEYSDADFVLIQDADLEYSPKDYPGLLEPIAKGKANVVYGSRFLSLAYPKGMLFLNYLGNCLGTFITNLLYGSRITDLMTGYKVLPCKILKEISLSSKGFDICAEITAKLLKKGIKIYEVPISYQGRARHEGKKIKTIDSLFILTSLCKFRFQD